MDINRAREIADSPVMQDVRYNGSPIYIQHVDETKETARIYPLDDPDQEFEVPVRSLTEPSSSMAMEVEQMACRVSDSRIEE
ncbi:small acid-soluble spore protein H (minor) [Paenibacillus cellulosilyticus]|uniref:Small acid-soluble spore protein H (Minor) n=1 Tax=Paenibacillus cellulosilyticus TaxID=375489 RepID=A0A2V2YXB3_9BACL|nr:small acid-soluble spore protein H (minor) [Paenibacillus cellulosilyticus]QKS45723.1 small acid-soluble spore protein H [Paenibacillus cellulosilyticus]